MSDMKTMELPDFIDKYDIPHSVIHKNSGISYQNLTNIISRRKTSKVMISFDVKSGDFRIYRPDIAAGKLDIFGGGAENSRIPMETEGGTTDTTIDEFCEIMGINIAQLSIRLGLRRIKVTPKKQQVVRYNWDTKDIQIIRVEKVMYSGNLKKGEE